MINSTLCYIEKDGKYLMLHRVKKENDANKDKWIGIGGKFEDGESPFECARREILEETGLDVIINENIFASTLYFPKKDVIKHVVFFLAEANSKIITLQESEVLSFKWVSEEEVLAELTYENDKQMFKKLI